VTSPNANDVSGGGLRCGRFVPRISLGMGVIAPIAVSVILCARPAYAQAPATRIACKDGSAAASAALCAQHGGAAGQPAANGSTGQTGGAHPEAFKFYMPVRGTKNSPPPQTTTQAAIKGPATVRCADGVVATSAALCASHGGVPPKPDKQ
jgi:hypothetical protein